MATETAKKKFKDVEKTGHIKDSDLKDTHVFLSTTSKNRRSKGGAKFEHIPGQCEILFPTADGSSYDSRILRYVPSASSIFSDEQSDNDLNKRVKSIKIFNDVLHVSGKDRKLLLYLRLAGYNAENEDMRVAGTNVLYREYKPDEEAKKRVQQTEAKDKARAKVHEMSINEIKAYSIALLDNYGRISDVEKQPFDVLKHDLLQKADVEPEGFLKGLQTMDMKYKFTILKAHSQGIVNIDEQNNRITYKDGSEITSCVQGVDVVEHLCDLAKETEDYQQILKDIAEKVDFGSKEEHGKKGNSDTLDEAVEKKIVEKKGNHYTYKTDSGENIRVMGKHKFMEKLQEDPNIFLEFYKKVHGS